MHCLIVHEFESQASIASLAESDFHSLVESREEILDLLWSEALRPKHIISIPQNVLYWCPSNKQAFFTADLACPPQIGWTIYGPEPSNDWEGFNSCLVTEVILFDKGPLVVVVKRT